MYLIYIVFIQKSRYMKEKKMIHVDKLNRRKFVIEEAGNDLGYYLYVFDIDTGNNTADYLQDTIELVLEDAKEYYGISNIDWLEVWE